MRALRCAIACCLTTCLAASAQQPPQPQPRLQRAREMPRPYQAAELAGTAVEVPMLEGRLAIVEVRVNGQGPYRFGIDTGAAGGARIDKSLIEKLGIQIVGQARAGDTSGANRTTVDLVEIGKLAVGDAVFSGVRAAVGDYVELGVTGILGIGLFSEHLLTLDYPHRRVRIERGELPPADGLKILGFDAPFGIPSVRLRLGGVEVEAQIDSGNTRNEIVVPASLTSRLKLAAEPVVIGKARTRFNEIEIRQAPLAGALVLGSYELRDPRIDIVDLFPRPILGHQFLQRFAVTIDGKNRRVRFEEGAPPASTSAPH